MSLSLTKEDQKNMIKLLKSREFEKAYEVVTGFGWWSDTTATNDLERENFLYKVYFAYDHLLFLEGVKEIEKDEAHLLMRQLKLQLDKELGRVQKGIYEIVEV